MNFIKRRMPVMCISNMSRRRSAPARLLRGLLAIPLMAFCVACAANQQSSFSVSSTEGNDLRVEALAEFDSPWAMTFLPDGQLLVTEKGGQLWIVRQTPGSAETRLAKASAEQLERVQVTGLPGIQANGQGGLGDVIIHPDFEQNGLLYISYVERDEDGSSGAAVMRATLDMSDQTAPALVDQDVIWRQSPKVRGEGHYGHRLAFSSDGYLYITSGERQKFDPAQDMEMNLGKVVRLFDDGRVPPDNPWAGEGGVAEQFWSIGHRNPLGIAFSKDGELWVHEMGPRGGDELNRVVAGGNFGYPLVSNGQHYNGDPIPDHDTRPDLNAPEITWTPVISPSGLVIYDGTQYEGWQGTGLIGGLSSQALVRVSLGDAVGELERFDMQARIREVEEDAEGVVYLLEDKNGGRLLRLTAE